MRNLTCLGFVDRWSRLRGSQAMLRRCICLSLYSAPENTSIKSCWSIKSWLTCCIHSKWCQLGSDRIRNFPTEPNLIRTWRQGSVNRTETNRTEPGARAFEIGNLKMFFSDARAARARLKMANWKTFLPVAHPPDVVEINKLKVF